MMENRVLDHAVKPLEAVDLTAAESVCQQINLVPSLHH